MIVLSVQSDLDRAVRHLDKIGKGGQLAFAAALALTDVGYQSRRDVLREISRRFNAPTPLTQRAVEIRFSGKRGAKRVDKRNLSLLVELTSDISKGTDPKRYLAAQVHGGTRNVKRSEARLRRAGILPPGWYAVPGPSAPLDAYGNIPGPIYTAMLAGAQTFNEGGYEANSRRGGLRRVRFFVVRPGQRTSLPPGIYSAQNQGVQIGRGRKGRASIGTMRLWLSFTNKVPRYTRRLPFYEIVARSINLRFPMALDRAIKRALSTAK